MILYLLMKNISMQLSTTAVFLRLLGLACSHFSPCIRVFCSPLAFQSQFSHRIEQIIDVFALLRTDQLQHSSQSIGILLNMCIIHFLLITSIDFIAHNRQNNILGSIGLQLLYPFLHNFKAAFRGDIIDAECNLGLSVVNGGNRSILFLAGCVPNLTHQGCT